MNAIRNILGITGGLAAGYSIASLFLLTARDVAIGVAISAAAVIGIYLVKVIQDDRQRERDKAQHPSVWVPIQPGDPYIEYAAPDQTPIWPRYTMQPGSWRIKDDGR
jgi:hypothetical protein